jgi:hypothetical protein
VRFRFCAAEDQGIRKAGVTIAGAGTPPLDQYWEDGPQLTGWGAAVGTYPDGTPAIVEGSFGTGWVILSGVHPEAPASWRGGMTFKTYSRWSSPPCLGLNGGPQFKHSEAVPSVCTKGPACTNAGADRRPVHAARGPVFRADHEATGSARMPETWRRMA